MTTNKQIAHLLEEISDLYKELDDEPFRMYAYQDAAQTARHHDESLAEIVKRDGAEALEDLHNIGEGIASVIGEFVSDGRSSLLDDLQASASPTALMDRVPGIGQKLANRIVKQLDIQSLEELEIAAHDGTLAEVEGFGEGRIRNVQDVLAGRLSRSAQRNRQALTRDNQEALPMPPVSLLLQLDDEYRKKSEQGKLKTISPRRFNPNNAKWLPIMNVSEQGWDFTVLYSNTKQAHELNKTRDWVVIYYKQNGKESHSTIVTETKGDLKDLRVVRGREDECRTYYEWEKTF